MKIDLAHDRTDHHPARYRDPVVKGEGVFAHLEQDELSEQEQARALRHEAQLAKHEQAENAKPWTPKQILKRITALYKAFTKPKEKV